MQRFERERTQQYFLYVAGACSAAGQAQQEAADELHADAMAQHERGGSTTALKHVLEAAAMHGALAVLLKRNAAKHKRWYEQAVASFQGLTV